MQMSADPLQHVLRQQPLGLLFDIDGVLSPIAPTPGEARLHPEVRPLLEQLKEKAHVAIVTGRAVESGAAMVNVAGITYIGTHGAEWSDGLPTSSSVQLVAEVVPYVEPGKRVLDLAERELAGLPGVLIERKRIGGSIHYRLSPDPEEMRLRILSLLEEPAHQSQMHLSDGKRVVDVKPAIAINKGHALRRFVDRFAIQGATFAGDDRTDIDAMKELKILRAEGRATLSIAVKHSDTLPEVLAQADIVVSEVDGMVELLHEMVKILQTQ